ncbi:hypothetical protein GCM10010271_03250 [Streptomyces kurssanovii]|nr:hypothetical protein GCM10010271_03250 [Streptomyces kurssanovii]
MQGGLRHTDEPRLVHEVCDCGPNRIRGWLLGPWEPGLDAVLNRVCIWADPGSAAAVRREFVHGGGGDLLDWQ